MGAEEAFAWAVLIQFLGSYLQFLAAIFVHMCIQCKLLIIIRRQAGEITLTPSPLQKSWICPCILMMYNPPPSLSL